MNEIFPVPEGIDVIYPQDAGENYADNSGGERGLIYASRLPVYAADPGDHAPGGCGQGGCENCGEPSGGGDQE